MSPRHRCLMPKKTVVHVELTPAEVKRVDRFAKEDRRFRKQQVHAMLMESVEKREKIGGAR